MNSPFLFLFSFILSRLISRFVYRRLDRHESKDSALFVSRKSFSLSVCVKNVGSRLQLRVNEFKLRNGRNYSRGSRLKTRVRGQLNDGVIEAR